MPFASIAQYDKFRATPSLRKWISEFSAGVDFSKLPARVAKPQPKHARRTAITAMLAAGGNHRR
jgi:hypothetical protein